MTAPALSIEDAVATLAPFAGLSRELVREYVLVGEELTFPAGAKLVDEGEPGLGLDFLLEGRIEFWARTGDRETHYDVFEAPLYYGHEPLLADIPAPVSGRFVEAARVYRIPPERFWPMLGACPTILKALVGSLAQRFQDLGSASQQGARLGSVATMAAGLAHELNNPAAGAVRAARELEAALPALADAALALPPGEARSARLARVAIPTEEEVARARAVRELDPLDRADREGELADWLADVVSEAAADHAPDLVGAGLDVSGLGSVLAGLPAPAAEAAVAWIAGVRNAAGLAGEVTEATGRIAEIVEALRGYARLDEAPVVETDVHAGIDAALRILAPELGPGIEVVRAFDPVLPPITAYAAELNAVWANLLDNAVKAVGERGRITITTRARGAVNGDGAHVGAGTVSVEVADDGPGVPQAIRDRVFDPFFTTREVGAGTGLGLDVARRIVVGRHHGELRILDPLPGAPGARFEVVLPIAALAG